MTAKQAYARSLYMREHGRVELELKAISQRIKEEIDSGHTWTVWYMGFEDETIVKLRESGYHVEMVFNEYQWLIAWDGVSHLKRSNDWFAEVVTDD